METQTYSNRAESVAPKQAGRPVRIVDVQPFAQEAVFDEPTEGDMVDMIPGRPVRFCNPTENAEQKTHRAVRIVHKTEEAIPAPF